MSGLIMAAQLIAGLAILVTLHELGHFLAARAFGIKVEKFYLFFDAWNFKLFSFKIGDTEYGMGWLPLGGYVKIAGMIDESMDTTQMQQEPQPWEFRSKPAWQRLIVMVGGIVVNVILGVFIFWMLTFKYGETYTPIAELKHGIVAYEVAQEIGLKTGDKITEINGKSFEHFEDLLSPKVLLANTTLTVVRDSQTLKITFPPDFIEHLSTKGKDRFIDKRFTFFIDSVVKGSGADKAGLLKKDIITAVDSLPIHYFDELQDFLNKHKREDIAITTLRNNDTLKLNAQVDSDGKLGFFSGTNDYKPATQYYGFAGSFVIGSKRAFSVVTDNLKGFKKIFKGEISARNSVQGPVGMAQIYGGHWDWLRFWTITGLLSMILAFMNILPIPALDGGHMLFLIIESLTGRKMSDKFMEKAQMVGMILVLSLMLFAVGNDFVKLFTR